MRRAERSLQRCSVEVSAPRVRSRSAQLGCAVALAVGLAAAFTSKSAAARCTSNADCPATPLLHCDVDAAAPECVECLGDGDCAGGRRCERDEARVAFTKCVECTRSHAEACSADRAGRECLAAGTCGCVSDDDCGPSGRVCVDASCRAGCRGDGSRGCSDGERCSAVGATAGVCGRIPTPPASAPTNDAGVDAAAMAPAIPLTSGGGCSTSSTPAASGTSLLGLSGFGLSGLALALARRKRARGAVMAVLMALATVGCGHAPTPLRPGYEGSVGLPHRGVLVGGIELGEDDAVRFLRTNGRRFATPRFARVLARAAHRVAEARPYSVLTVGDLSAKTGGTLLPHLSHRSGRDADLLLYVTTLEGAPVTSPGFVHVREDGLAWDEQKKRFLRFDVERQWLLLKALLEDDEGAVQFVFASRTIRAMLIRWAVARGEPTELVYRALTVLVQPQPGGEHDDHFHVRTACTPEEQDLGCEPSGPARPWLARRAQKTDDDTRALVGSLFTPASVAEDAP